MKAPLLIVLLILAACSASTITTNVIPTEHYAAHEAKSSNDVDMFDAKSEINRPFTEIAVLVAENIREDPRMIMRLRNEAAKIGADAIILQKRVDGVASENGKFQRHAIAVRYGAPPEK